MSKRNLGLADDKSPVGKWESPTWESWEGLGNSQFDKSMLSEQGEMVCLLYEHLWGSSNNHRKQHAHSGVEPLCSANYELQLALLLRYYVNVVLGGNS